ncbi:MAG: zinc ribbon domain-containing protein [Promethearchaeota archaeon]|jgi:hypothetical protein
MNRDDTTWFGIKLTQKQATNLFVLSIVGIFITFFIAIQMLMPLLYMFTSPYFYGDIRVFLQSILMMLPYLTAFIIGLILSIYTFRKSRRIAKSYSELMSAYNFKPNATMYCPNCGNKRSEKERFCKQCGQELR